MQYHHVQSLYILAFRRFFRCIAMDSADPRKHKYFSRYKQCYCSADPFYPCFVYCTPLRSCPENLCIFHCCSSPAEDPACPRAFFRWFPSAPVRSPQIPAPARSCPPGTEKACFSPGTLSGEPERCSAGKMAQRKDFRESVLPERSFRVSFPGEKKTVKEEDFPFFETEMISFHIKTERKDIVK